jgi:hypothetical protein
MWDTGGRNSRYKLKLIFLIFFGLNTLNFPYISEELTDKYHLRKSILACIIFPKNAILWSQQKKISVDWVAKNHVKVKFVTRWYGNKISKLSAESNNLTCLFRIVNDIVYGVEGGEERV